MILKQIVVFYHTIKGCLIKTDLLESQNLKKSLSN